MNDEGVVQQATKSYLKNSIISTLVLLLISIPLPSEKQIAILSTSYVLTNAKDVSKLPDNLVSAINAYLTKITTEKKK
jgi:hypothetical protein